MRPFFLIPSFEIVVGRSYPKQCLWIMVEAPGFLFWKSALIHIAVEAILNPGRYDVDLERRVLRQSLLTFSFDLVVLCSSNCDKPDRRSQVAEGRLLG